ncbi:MAG: AAA family ATPase [Myxococcales bacterium FL481]|nr:MAG: AAA family ATPase [Myxococcales bacterium FL481]
MLSPELKQTLDFAIKEARRRHHEYITLEHLLLALLDDKSARQVLSGCGGDVDQLRGELESFLHDNMPRLEEEGDVQQTVGFGRVLQRAVLHVQGAGKREVTGSNVLVAMYAEPESYAVYLLEKQGIRRRDVTLYISHGIGKQSGGPSGSGRGRASPAVNPAHRVNLGDDDGDVADDPLAAYTVDLRAKAEAGKIDELIGRDQEITRVIQVLCRRRKNNPVLVGDPGVGKTAVVEGLALRVYQNKVPGALRDAHIYALDMGSLLAGTKFRGQFEERLNAVIEALKAEPGAIMFVDEIHTVVGAGATSGGSMDASNMLKPVLNSGELRCIGATTYKEFKSSFERDPALARRFQKIEIVEPSVDETILILQGLKPVYEIHHNVEYTPESLEQAVRLAHKHLRDRRLPDSAIDVMDETGAAVRLERGEDGEPADEAAASDGDEAAAQGGSVAAPARDAAGEIYDDFDPEDDDDDLAEFDDDEEEVDLEEVDFLEEDDERRGQAVTPPGLTAARAGSPPIVIDVEQVEAVIARMARIPPKSVSSDDREMLRELDEGLRQVVFGQDEAVGAVAAAIKRARAGLARADKPIGCYLFAGPTGVGKTELAKQLARLLGMPFLRFDMSEYMEKHSVSRLIGAPPGYVGFDQGGLMTDAVAKNPHSVLLLDEIEKAHPDIFSVLLQVMDNATLTDTTGRKTDFRNVILIMTTNVGAHEMTQRTVGFDESTTLDTSGAKKALERLFTPEFRNRLDKTVMFDQLPEAVIRMVADKMLRELEIQLADRDVHFSFTDAACDWIAKKGYDKVYGARPMARAIDEQIKAKLVDELLFGRLEHGGTVHVDLDPQSDELTFRFESRAQPAELVPA